MPLIMHYLKHFLDSLKYHGNVTGIISTLDFGCKYPHSAIYSAIVPFAAMVNDIGTVKG